MKKILLALMVVSFCFISAAADKKAKESVLESDTIIWAGLDYSLVRMVGPGDFRNPEGIFPGMLTAWNDLFLVERLPSVEKLTRKRVIVDIGGVTEANKKATTNQVIHTAGPKDTIDESHITPEDIARAVKGYKLENKSGPAIVFIADRFLKPEKKGQGAVYVVCFDAASLKVIFSERKVSNAVGFGFRNYWFRIIKDAEPALSNCR